MQITRNTLETTAGPVSVPIGVRPAMEKFDVLPR